MRAAAPRPPDALVVDGAWPRGSTLVPVERVAAVSPRERRITLAADD